MTYTYEQVDKAERDRLLAQLNAEKEDLKRKRYVLSLEFRDIANLLEDASSVNDLDLAFAQALALKCKVEDLLDEALEIKKASQNNLR